MNKTLRRSDLSHPGFPAAMVRRIPRIVGLAIVQAATGVGVAQIAMPSSASAAPNGYTLHGSTSEGGGMVSVAGSGAMYDTLTNVQSGPRAFGQSFELTPLPATKHTLVDYLSAYTSGFGGDPYNFASLRFYKGKLYEFTGTFHRDRQYFDYDLLGNPNIPSGQSIPVGSSNAPTGSFAWPQVTQSPFLYDTVRRMTDTRLTLFPISKVTYHFAYTQNVMQGPSLSPGASDVGGSIGLYDALLDQYQRNSTDDFIGGFDWKPVLRTTLTFEEEIDHYKDGTYFTLAPSSLLVQEANGMRVALGDWDSLAPYGIGACNTGSMGAAYTNSTTYTILSPAQTPGSLPIINPACSVAAKYLRSAPTRALYPSEIFRFESSSLRNVTMNGDVRYTGANMNLPNYYENFEGLNGGIRTTTFTGSANARRNVSVIDYAIGWDAAKTVSIADQLVFSNVQQPGVANISAGITANTPPNPNETINYSGPLSPGANLSVEGSPNGRPLPDFFGRKSVTNNLSMTWYGWSRATFSLTYRYNGYTIAEGIPHSAPLAPGATNNGTVTVHSNGGIFNVGLQPANHWDVSGSIELLFADNAFTPLTPRQTGRYRAHAIYRPKSGESLSIAYNDVERRNNTNNTGSPSAAGPLSHSDHSRVLGVGGVVSPGAHYGFDFNYSYSDVYTATNICYDAAASPLLPGAATASGTACPGAAVRGTKYYEFGPVKDFMKAPTQYASVNLHLALKEGVGAGFGYVISSVNGRRFFNDARDVNGSLVSAYQSPFVDVAWVVRKSWSLSAVYNYYGYGEGGPSGAALCSISNPTPTSPVAVVACNSPSLAGRQTGLTISSAGETAPRNFHANNVILGLHHAF